LAAKELYIYRGNQIFALLSQVVYQRDTLGHATNVQRFDPSTGQSRVIYQADWKGTPAWPADLKLNETDESGISYAYSYDTLKRVQTKTKQPGTGQSAIVVTSSYDAASRVVTNAVSADSLSQKVVSHYDLAGRLKDQTSLEGLTTAYTYQNGGRQTTVTASSGTTQVIAKYCDRRVASITVALVTSYVTQRQEQGGRARRSSGCQRMPFARVTTGHPHVPARKSRMLRCCQISVHLQPKPGIAVASLSRSAEVGVADTALATPAPVIDGAAGHRGRCLRQRTHRLTPATAVPR
jgi:hypothetical protein